jgi:hypothetical protein
MKDKTDESKILAMFQYLSEVKVNESLSYDIGFIFGRADAGLADRAAELFRQGKIKYIVIAGGLGKDSGPLIQLDIPEAVFLGTELAVRHKIPPEKLILESKSTNGGENSRLGINKFLEAKIPHKSVLLVAHPTPLRRHAASFEKAAEEKNMHVELGKTTIAYDFDPSNEFDQKEAVGEIMRLTERAKLGYIKAQPELTSDARLMALVEYAKSLHAKGISNYKG